MDLKKLAKGVMHGYRHGNMSNSFIGLTNAEILALNRMRLKTRDVDGITADISLAFFICYLIYNENFDIFLPDTRNEMLRLSLDELCCILVWLVRNLKLSIDIEKANYTKSTLDKIVMMTNFIEAHFEVNKLLDDLFDKET